MTSSHLGVGPLIDRQFDIGKDGVRKETHVVVLQSHNGWKCDSGQRYLTASHYAKTVVNKSVKLVDLWTSDSTICILFHNVGSLLLIINSDSVGEPLTS